MSALWAFAQTFIEFFCEYYLACTKSLLWVFFCVLFLSFLIVSWGNKCVRFFACFDFAFCIVWAHPCCLVCRWVFCLLVCFLILYVHLRAYLIFSSDFMLCLIVFCCQIAHICISCFSAGCYRCHFFNLSDFLCTHFRFCCLNRPLITFTLRLASCFALFLSRF